MRDGGIAFAAVGLTVANAVEPVTGPVLGEMGRRDEPVDEFLPAVGGGVGTKRGPFLRRGRQAGQGKGGPTQERVGIGFAGRRDAGGGELRREEPVHGMVARCEPRGSGRIAGRHGGPLDRLQAPPLFAAGKDRVPRCLLGEFVGRGGHAARIRRTQCDPSLEGSDDLSRRLGAALRHEQIAFMPKRGHDHAFGRPPRHDGRS